MPKIQLRHDTSTNWTTYNPVLLEGECGVETDTNKFKFGDGTTPWNSLDYVGGDLSNYYTKSETYSKTETNTLLDDKIPNDSPVSPLEYSVTSTGVDCINNNGTLFWSKNDTIGEMYVIPYYDSNDGSIYTRTKGSPASGVIDTDYVITYNGSLSDKVIQFTDCNDSDYFYGTTELGCYIGNTDSDGVFTPYFCIANDSSYNYRFMELSGITRSQDDYGYGFTKWQASIRSTSNAFYRSLYNPLAWKIKIAVADNNGVPEFTISTYLKDGSSGSTVTYTPTYNTDITDLNTVVFPMHNYQASSSQYNYTIADWGIFDNQGNQTWNVTDITYTRELYISEDIVGWGMPDYSAVISIASTPYTITQKGYVLSPTYVLAPTGTTELRINNYVVLGVQNGSGGYERWSSGMFPVDVGDIVTDVSANLGLVFIPCKGGQ